MTLFVLSTALTKAQPCIDVRIEGSIDNAIIDGCATEIVLSAESGANFQSWLSGGGSVHLYVVKENNRTNIFRGADTKLMVAFGSVVQVY